MGGVGAEAQRDLALEFNTVTASRITGAAGSGRRRCDVVVDRGGWQQASRSPDACRGSSALMRFCFPIAVASHRGPTAMHLGFTGAQLARGAAWLAARRAPFSEVTNAIDQI